MSNTLFEGAGGAVRLFFIEVGVCQWLGAGAVVLVLVLVLTLLRRRRRRRRVATRIRLRLLDVCGVRLSTTQATAAAATFAS